MSGIFQKLMDIGLKLGTVTAAHMYGDDYMNVEGASHEGKQFTLSLHIKEENEND